MQNFPNNFTLGDSLQRKKIELEEIYSFEAQGAFVRAKTKYKIDGERPTKLFCSLEKHNGTQKYIPRKR